MTAGSESVASRAEERAFYASPGLLTELHACPPTAFKGLPGDPAALCRVVQGLVVHEEVAPAYGLELTDERRRQVRTRPAAAMVDLLRGMDPAPLCEPRPPERRMVGNCRHFATLSSALLRRAGVPARARCGFAAYFEADKMLDHWVTEYFSAENSRWVRVDAQLDDLQRELFKPAFDPDDIPTGPFLPAAEAWQACRAGKDDPGRFGIFDMWGLWFIRSNVIRDLAALNKMELLPWDAWGPMTFGRDPDDEEARFIDRISSVITTNDTAAIRHLYDENESLRVPPTVFDGRFGEPHHLALGKGP